MKPFGKGYRKDLLNIGLLQDHYQQEEFVANWIFPPDSAFHPVNTGVARYVRYQRRVACHGPQKRGRPYASPAPTFVCLFVCFRDDAF